MTKDIVYRTGEHSWSDEICDAVQHYLEYNDDCGVGDTIFIDAGYRSEVTGGSYVTKHTINNLIEIIEESAWEAVDELADGFALVETSKRDELLALVKKWADENVVPTWYEIDGNHEVKHVLTHQDLEDVYG